MKAIFLTFISILLSTILFAKDFKPELYNKVLEECLQDLKQVSKNKLSTIKQSIQIIRNSPIEPGLRQILIAKSYIVLFDFKSALAITDSLLKVNKKNKEAWYVKGLALRYSGDHTESLKCLQNAIDENEKNVNKLFELSIAYLLMRKSDQAIKYLKILLKINPEHTKAKIKLGGSWLNAGKPQKALEVYEEALIKNPNHSMLLYNIGHVANILNQPDKAISHLKKAIKLHPTDWLAVQKLVQVYDKISNHVEANKYHQEMIRLRESNKTPNLKKKASYIRMNQRTRLWTIYGYYYFKKSKLLSNQTSFSIINNNTWHEKMKFNLVSQIKDSKKIYLLNVYYPDKTFKKYLEYKTLPNYEIIKKDVLRCPLLSPTPKASKKKK